MIVSVIIIPHIPYSFKFKSETNLSRFTVRCIRKFILLKCLFLGEIKTLLRKLKIIGAENFESETFGDVERLLKHVNIPSIFRDMFKYLFHDFIISIMDAFRSSLVNVT